jgi:hypothetical protein
LGGPVCGSCMANTDFNCIFEHVTSFVFSLSVNSTLVIRVVPPACPPSPCLSDRFIVDLQLPLTDHPTPSNTSPRPPIP